MRNFNSESFPPYDNSIEPTLDLTVPLSKWPNESPLQPTWKTRIKEKLAKVRDSFGTLKNIWNMGDNNKGYQEAQDTVPSQYLDSQNEIVDPFEGDDEEAPKVKLTGAQARKKILAEAVSLSKVLLFDRGNTHGARTKHQDGYYVTTFPKIHTEENNLPDTNMANEMANADPFGDEEKENGFEDARIGALENLELKEKAKNARERIKKLIPNMIEKYDKLPLTGKLAISGALVGAGIVATVSGSGALAAGVWGGKLAMRGVGSYLAGRTAEKLMRAHAMKNLAVGQELSKEKEKKLKLMNVATAVSVFLAGTWAEYALHGAPAFMNSGVESHAVTSALPTHAPAPIATDAIIRTPNVDVAAPAHVPSAVPSVDQLARHTNFVGIHEVVVRPGDTLTKVLLHGGIYEMFQPEDIAKLSWQGKQNLLANIVNNLTAEQLKDVGITSGKANLLKLGDTIDVMKLARIAKEITVTVAGEKVPLLKRALELS